jgi:predicted permease
MNGDALYALLLRIYPRAFRDRFGTGMRHAFAEEYDAVRRDPEKTPRAIAAFWMTSIAQAAVYGLAARAARPQTSPSMPVNKGSRMRSMFVVDWRDAFRALRAAPVVTAVAVLSLALGIGANTALFSIFNGLLLKPLPVANPDRLVLVDEGTWTNPIWEEIRAQRHEIVEDAFAWGDLRFNLADRGQTDYVYGAFASGGMFDVLGVRPAMGRLLTEEDDVRSGGPQGPAAVISYGLWQQRFGGARDVIGRQITVERLPVTIVGVMPREFFGPVVGRTLDIVLPINVNALIPGEARLLDGRSTWWLDIIGRLKPGQTIDEAQAALRARQPRIRAATIPQDWNAQDQAGYLKDPLSLVSASTGASGLRGEYERPLQTVMILVGAVLLIACANIASLLLARASARRRELTLRLALGASRARLARQLLAESLLLGLGGAALGLLLARWAGPLLVRQLSTRQTVSLDLSIDWRVLAFTTAVGAAMALVFGLAPAFGAARLAPNDALHEDDSRTMAGDSGLALRNLLVVGQVAISLSLVAFAILFIRTLTSLTGASLGFEPRPLLVASLQVPADRVPDEARLGVFERMRQEALAVPGVADAALSALVPVGNVRWNTLLELPPGRPAVPPRERAPWVNIVSPNWFSTFGMHLVAGRTFTTADRAGAPFVIVVNESFVHKFLEPGNPIGQTVRAGLEAGPTVNTYQVVGVVNDAVYQSARAGFEPTMYAPLAQLKEQAPDIELTVRAAGGAPGELSRALTSAVMRVNGDVSVTYNQVEERLRESVTQERLVAILAGFFGALALLLAALGLYGVTTYGVGRRRRELGVRLALGAQPSGVLQLVLRRVALLVIAGVAIGAALTLWASHFVASLLFGLQPQDPITLAVAAFALLTIGLVAGWLPARRAALIDPGRVLRE